MNTLVVLKQTLTTEDTKGSWYAQVMKWLNNNGLNVEILPPFRYCACLKSYEWNYLLLLKEEILIETEVDRHMQAPWCPQRNRKTQNRFSPTVGKAIMPFSHARA